jgi:hypothetical protein
VAGTDGTVWAESKNWESIVQEEMLDEQFLSAIIGGYDDREGLYNTGINVGNTHFVNILFKRLTCDST